MTRQEQLQEQMEDTVFALLMNEVMQRESAHIWTEYQAEKEAGHDLSVPEDTDRRMRAFIRRQFRRKRYRNARKTILHVMQVSAAVFCVLTIVSATAFGVLSNFSRECAAFGGTKHQNRHCVFLFGRIQSNHAV